MNVVRCFAIVLVALTVLAQAPGEKPELVKVTDRVYCATGYALGNVIYILTDKSVVVVDTTESPAAARRTLEEFRKVSALPVSYIIYTHFHGDHINGARVFRGEGTKVIAQRQLPVELAGYMRVAAYNRRLNALQFGATLPPEQRGISLAALSGPQEIGYVPPDILFDDHYSFEEGGVQFELYHAPGETFDHLNVWLPQERAMLPGDLFYQSFPMLSSPMKPARPVLEWAESLERIRKLAPAFLVGSHNRPLRGKEEIDTTLGNYAKAIRFVHDETVQRINEGLPLEEIRRQVRLPEELAQLPYLQPRYGRVDWSVNGIYRQYTGWYDFDPAHLNPGPSAEFHRALVEAAGGAAPLLGRAQKALRDGRPQTALELVEVVLGPEPENRQAHALAAEALEKLGAAAVNTVERNIYLAAALEHRKFL